MAFSLVSTHAKAGAAGACGRPQAALCLQSRIGKDCISLQLGLANSPSASAPSRTGVVAAAKGFAAGPPPDAAKPLPEEDIEVAQEVLSDCKVAFTVTLPVSMVQEAWNRTLRDLRSNSPMDGFRSGAAVPESLLLARCGGRRKVNGACIENILQTTYPMVLQRGLQGRWLSDSEKVESKFDDMLDAFALDKPFTYKISAEVMPDMQWTQPYTGLQATVSNLVPAENDEAEVAKLVLSVRKQHGTMRVVADRGLQLGDVAVVDFTTRRTDLDEDIQGLAQKRFRLDTDDADAFPPGVVEQMVGQKLGEEKSYSFTFPADWEPEALRNVDCTFTVQVLELFEFELAEMDDELAERIRPSSGGVEPLLRELRQGVASARQQQNDARRINTVTELIRDRCSIEVPECLVRDFGYQQYQDSLVNAFEKGSLTYSAMKEMATEQLAENYINSKRAELTEKYRIVLAFDDIYKREGLSIDEERVEAEFVATRAQFTQGDANGVEEKDLDEERLREQIVDQMKRMAVLDFLIANGDVQEVYA